ncbi:MAG TPA: CARDB domain-containing protein [Tepidisphaeraceae bacterium]|nr:CARDB domain-containing protein [Tepidisphaeraceae bacterium]
MRRATCYAVEVLERRTLLSALSWVGSASGDYDDPTQWSGGAVPTAADDVTINAGPGITITHSAGIDAVNSLTSNNPFVLSGGALSVATTLTLTDTFTLTGGKLSNATVAGNPNELIATGSGMGASTLDAVTLNADQTIGDGAIVNVFDSLTLNGTTLTIASDGQATGVLFEDSPSQTLGGTGQIVFAGTLPLNNIITIDNQSGSLTIGSGITIHGSSGQIVANNLGGNPMLQGTIAADTAGQTITLSGGAFVNAGAVEAINGGTLTDNAQMNGTIVENNSTLNIGYTVNSVPVLTRVGGTVNLTGVIDFFGGTMPFNSATGSWNLVGGIARNSHLAFSGTDSLVLTGSGGIFSNITLDSNLDLPIGASLTINNGLTLNNTTLSVESGATLAFDNLPSSGQTLGGTGDILLAGGVAATLDSTSAGLTVASGITIHGAGALSVQDNDVLQGIVSADVTGQTLSISGMNSVVQGTVQAINGSTLDLGIGLDSAGVISETNSTIIFGGTYNALPTVVRSGGFLIMAGTLDLGDGFQVFDDTTGVWILTGTLQHGIISFAGAGGLVPGGLDPVFQSVTLNSDMTLPDGIRLIVQGDLTLNARLTIASDGLFTTLFFDGSGAVNLNGTGNVVFGGTVPATDVFTANACDLTIQANVSLFGAGGTLQTLAGGTLDLQGLVSVNSPGNTLVIQGTGIAFQGTLQAFGGTIDIQGDLPTFAVTFINVLLGPGFAGQINVSGNASLGGQLNIFLATGFVPAQGSTFNVLTYQSSTGDFGGFSGLTSPGVVFTPAILPGDYVLNTTQGGPAAPTGNLTLSGITDTPGTYRPGDTITASMSENNSAPADTGGFDIQVNLSTDPFFANSDDIPLETIHVAGTPGTFRVDISAVVPASAMPGSYFLVASTDIANVVPETNETDNATSTAGADIIVQPPLLTPDLGTGLITYTPGTYKAGDAFDVPIGFSNFGSAGTGPFEIDVVLSQDTVFGNADDVIVGRLAEGGFAGAGSSSDNAMAIIPSGILPGSYHVLVMLDAANAVPETNKANNLFVSAMADVVIPAPPVPPTPKPVVVGGVNVNFGVNGLAGHSVGITTVADIALQPDGKSIIVGTGGPAGAEEFVLTRYTANGSIDRTFGNQGTVTTDFGGRDDKAAAVWLLPGGQFLVAGTSTRMAGGIAAGSAFALARYNADGSLDTTFGQGTGEVLTSFGGDSAVSTSNDIAHALTVRGDGAIFIAGSSDVSGSGLEFAIAAFNSDGSLSQSFGNIGKTLVPFTGGDASIGAIAFAKGNALVAAGSFTNATTGVTSMALSAMRANGAPNKTFGKNGQVTQGLRGIDDEATSVAIAPDGRIIIGGLSVTGSATAGTLTTDFALVRFTTAGRVDKSFHRGQVITSFGQPTAITKILIEPSGKIVASGKTASSLSAVVPNQLGLALAQYNTNGSLDTTFNGTGKSILSLNGGTVAARPAGVVGASLVRAAAPSSDLLNKFDQLKQTAQGALATNQGGELFAIGNSGTDTVEAAVVANGVDLTGNSLTLRGAVKTGKPATIAFTLSNQGNVAMTGATAAQVFASSDQTLASGTMLTTISAIKLSLKGGASKPFTQKVTVPKSLPAGTYFLLLQLDPGNTLSELDLTNNLLVSGATFVVR